MVREAPLTGAGLGQYPVRLQRDYPPLQVPNVPYVAHAHNFLLQLAVDFGLPGALAVLGVLGAFFRGLWRAGRDADDRGRRALAAGLTAGMVAYLVFGITDAIALPARGGIVFWVVLGLGAAVIAAPAGARPRRDSHPGGAEGAETG
jgi:O-antigen ligase